VLSTIHIISALSGFACLPAHPAAWAPGCSSTRLFGLPWQLPPAGGFLQLRTGLKSAGKSAVFGGVLLAMIEGVGILLTRVTAPPPAPGRKGAFVCVAVGVRGPHVSVAGLRGLCAGVCQCFRRGSCSL